MAKRTGSLDRVLSLVFGVIILVVIGAIIYLNITPKIGDKFTEFYILGLEGKAASYPEKLMVGEEAKVIVGIVNHEYEELSYQLKITIDGVRNKEIGPVVLAHEGKWEQEVSFTPVKAAEKQKVEFLLYRHGVAEPYRTLHLWIDVK